MHRFKMDLSNSNNRIVAMSMSQQLPYAPTNPILKPSSKMSSSLNSPMIERVYKARPGCSACGKKVA
jgi:hypothetical protein